MIKNAYVHIPFCRSKCNYCSFISFCNLNDKDAYLNALKSQIKSEYKGEELNTLYFGGGTPSLLTIEEFKTLLSLFNYEQNVEITVEVNPDSVDLKYLSKLYSLGVNRLSIGIQTFDDEILKLIGRRHTGAHAKLAPLCAQKAGFKNISIDFIYGLPLQTIGKFEKDLTMAVSLGVQHISLYGLKIEPDCFFAKNMPDNLPDSDIQADMYLKAIEVLKLNGFEHYEISNFAQAGFESQHNLNYWDANTYYGFGCAASGYGVVGQVSPTYEGTYHTPLTPTLSPKVRCDFHEQYRSGILARQHVYVRYKNDTDLNKYIKNPLKKVEVQELSEQMQLEEAIFLGLRKIAGINTHKINKKFNIDFDKKYVEILKKYEHFFIKTPGGWALNTNGILISNEIMSEFIDC